MITNFGGSELLKRNRVEMRYIREKIQEQANFNLQAKELYCRILIYIYKSGIEVIHKVQTTIHKEELMIK